MSDLMVLTETHHAGIIVAFYKELTELRGRENGLEIFLTAARAYGSRRGKRMAMRAMRDGNPLDIRSYFVYGELIFGNPEKRAEVSFAEVADGVVHQNVRACGWAEEFKDTGYSECGVAYCREIDVAIVRGFNPDLDFKAPNNLNFSSCCDFYFRGAEVTQAFFETHRSSLKPACPVKHHMAYHCADIWQMFCFVVSNVLPGEAEALIQRVRGYLADRYGDSFFYALGQYSNEDFDGI